MEENKGLKNRLRDVEKPPSKYDVNSRWMWKAKALFGWDGTVPLTHTNDRFETERRSFSQQKRSPNGTVPSQPNRA